MLRNNLPFVSKRRR
ncbi:uncharacterized protein FTOL_13926 [Fusarium torulosum]|uniref:Uncharacterized protein n=1 Tax=Fusarium torulosum TaxID=33205 RepID=A0AAE8MPQ3_9HYPO|nr:uncharacterized protein FTOL_13926 [Fusarium torulosum]